MLSHDIVKAIAVTGQLSLIDGATDAIDVQVAKTREILSKKLSSFPSSTYVQQQRDLDCLAVRWNTTGVLSICQGEGESFLIEMKMMSKMGTPVTYGGFPLMNLKFKTWLYLKTPLTNSIVPPLSTAMVRKLTCLLFQYNNLIQMKCALLVV
jgi:hypothetical protein